MHVLKRFLVLAMGLALFNTAANAETNSDKNNCDQFNSPKGILYLRAKNEIDLYRCLGYFHSENRLWQMDYLLRTAQGKLSEVYGFSKLKSDYILRALQLEDRSKTIYGNLSKATKGHLMAYSSGIQHSRKKLMEMIKSDKSLENTPHYAFEHFKIKPVKWEPHHSVTLILLQAFSQTRASIFEEYKEELEIQKNGVGKLSSTVIDHLPWDVSVLKSSELPKVTSQSNKLKTFASNLALKKKREALTGGITDELIPKSWLKPEYFGSNNWAVAPELSETGNALFANDPHLGLKHPPFWFWVSLDSENLKAVGATLPGVPVIVSGANKTMAWGLTNSYLDVGDLFYIKESELQDANYKRPTIWANWLGIKIPVFIKKLGWTKEGYPIIPLKAPKGMKTVLRWSGFKLKAENLENIWKLMKMKNASEADKYLADLKLPSWNFTYADNKGSIGYRATGYAPKKTKAIPFGIQRLSMKEVNSTTYLSDDEMPNLINPNRGFIATANNRHWPTTYHLKGARAYSNGMRAWRIEKLIKENKKHTLQSMKEIQCDNQAVDWNFLKWPVLSMLDKYKSEASKKAHALLNKWDGSTSKDCEACLFYRRWMEITERQTGYDEAGIYKILTSTDLNSHAHKKDISDIFINNLNQAFNESNRNGKPITWENAHLLPFSHLSGDSRLNPKKAIFSPGDKHSINPGTSHWDPEKNAYIHTAGASQRLVVELSKELEIWLHFSGPNKDSKNPDLNGESWQDFTNCNYHKVSFPLDWDSVKYSAVSF